MAILPGMEELFSLLKVKGWVETGTLRRHRHRLRADRRHGAHARHARGARLLLHAGLPHPAHRGPRRAADGPAPHRPPHPQRRRLRGGARRSTSRWKGWDRSSSDPKRSSIRIVLNPEKMVINESRAALHLPEPLRLSRGRGDRQPRPARGGPVEVLRPLVRDPGRASRSRARRPSAPLPFFAGPALRPRDGGHELLEVFAEQVFGRDRPHGGPAPGPARSR